MGSGVRIDLFRTLSLRLRESHGVDDAPTGGAPEPASWRPPLVGREGPPGPIPTRGDLASLGLALLLRGVLAFYIHRMGSTVELLNVQGPEPILFVWSRSLIGS